MLNKTCSACGSNSHGMIGMGGTLICRQCEPDVMAEITRLQSEKKTVNVAYIARAMYRETNSAGNYLLRDVPRALWDRAKHRAIDDGCSLRDLVLAAVEQYLNK